MSTKTTPVTKSPRTQSSGVKAYLVAYNLVSFMLWLRIACGIVLYMVNGESSRQVTFSWVRALTTSVFTDKVTSAAPIFTKYPAAAQVILQRAATMYDYIGPMVTFVQSLAVLEVVHAALGWVKSNVLVTGVQVASRIIVAWLIAEKYEASAHSPFYALMVLAWSLSEVARYPFYVNQILESPSYMATWARYSFFVVLYPLGVLGEMSLIWASLPTDQMPWQDMSGWSVRDLAFLALLPVYIPGLFMLYTRLLASRRKVLGNDFAGTKARRAIEEHQKAKFGKTRRLHEKQNMINDAADKAAAAQ